MGFEKHVKLANGKTAILRNRLKEINLLHVNAVVYSREERGFIPIDFASTERSWLMSIATDSAGVGLPVTTGFGVVAEVGYWLAFDWCQENKVTLDMWLSECVTPETIVPLREAVKEAYVNFSQAIGNASATDTLTMIEVTSYTERVVNALNTIRQLENAVAIAKDVPSIANSPVMEKIKTLEAEVRKQVAMLEEDSRTEPKVSDASSGSNASGSESRKTE